MTLGARNDLFERVGELIEHSALLKLTEERIGIEVPRASRKQISDTLLEWELYAAERRLRQENVPREVDDLISAMRGYIERADRVEMLRSELPEYLRKLLEKQRGARSDITEWVRRNAEAYKDFLSRTNERLSILNDLRELQGTMRDFHDRVNLPWCRIDLYTQPLYSLIGSWMPGRPGLGGGERVSCNNDDGLPSRVGSGLPQICTSKDDRSLIIDFTDVRLTSRSFTVPRLDIHMVDIDLPLAPASTIVADLSRIKLPELKPLPSIFPEADQLLPEQIRVEKLPEFTDIVKDISKVNVAATREAIAQAGRIIEGMTQSYSLFWNSFPTATADLRCNQWGSAPCGHTEDLIERVTRYSAQPMIFLPEHFAVSGLKSPADLGDDLAKCPVQDRVCERLTKALELPRMGIRAVFGKEAEDIAARVIINLRGKFRSLTLTADAALSDFPPTTLPAVRFYPVFWVPRSAELRVPPSS